MLEQTDAQSMIDVVQCAFGSDENNANGAAIWFLVLFATFVGVDSAVNAWALARTLKIWASDS